MRYVCTAGAVLLLGLAGCTVPGTATVGPITVIDEDQILALAAEIDAPAWEAVPEEPAEGDPPNSLDAGSKYQEIADFWEEQSGEPAACLPYFTASQLVVQEDGSSTAVVDLSLWDAGSEDDFFHGVSVSARISENPNSAGAFVDGVELARQECGAGYTLDSGYAVVELVEDPVPDGVSGALASYRAREVADDGYTYTATMLARDNVVLLVEVYSPADDTRIAEQGDDLVVTLASALADLPTA